MIARSWRGITRTKDAEEYSRYVENTGIAAYRHTPGFQVGWILTRTLGDQTVFLVLSLWESLDAVKAFAGEDPTTAVFYPEDDRFLLDRDDEVVHWDVALDGALRHG